MNRVIHSRESVALPEIVNKRMETLTHVVHFLTIPAVNRKTEGNRRLAVGRPAVALSGVG